MRLPKKICITIYKKYTRWTKSPKNKTLSIDCDTLIKLMHWLIDNIFETFGDVCIQQVTGIPMGTDCAPFLANLFCYSYEFEWVDKQIKLKKFHLIKHFKVCCRYIDDLFLPNNFDTMNKVMYQIYPKESTLVPDNFDSLTVPYLDLLLSVKNGVTTALVFDKRDAFDFPIVNFPTLTGNIPIKSSYGVFVCELVRYARVCTYYADFRERVHILVKKLLKPYYTLNGLKKSMA